MFEPLVIQSHSGPYTAFFEEGAFARLNEGTSPDANFLIDARVSQLYPKELSHVLSCRSVLTIEATEANKSLDKFEHYIGHLVGQNIRRGDLLVAIGGGIIQDITSFLAATLLRGLDWQFYPTTLLAQADSCIGSKSSINVGTVKNLLGTFTPPKSIFICTRVLETLDEVDIRSGIGEMLKAQAIDGPESFDRIASDYSRLMKDKTLMFQYIRRSLEIKKRIIELDEFDRGIRNAMNYGHSFGHAIESATDFKVPHGIAVTLGMDLANYVAVHYGFMDKHHYNRMHPTLAANYAGFEDCDIGMNAFFSALGKDKKNTGNKFNLILPDASAHPSRRLLSDDDAFRSACCDYFVRACHV